MLMDNKPTAKKKVLVVGGGFGGVFAAKALERLGRGGKLEVELVNANNYFVFQPLLPEVAASSIHSADAVVPLRQLLNRLQVRQAEVMGIDFDQKKVIVVQGARRVPVDLYYDELVIALGTGVDLKRFPGLPEHALTMKDLADAHRLRTHVIGCLETADVTEDPAIKQQLLSFVVVGAGFSGVETIAEVRELVRRALKYYHNIRADEDSLLPDRICAAHPAELPCRPRGLRDAAAHDTRHRGANRDRHEIGHGFGGRADRRPHHPDLDHRRHHRQRPASSGRDARPRHAVGPHQDRSVHARARPRRECGRSATRR